MITHALSNKDLPIFEFDVSKEIDLSEVKQIIIDYKKTFKMSRVSTASGWHSSFFTHLKDPKFQPLVQFIERKMNSKVSPSILKNTFIKANWTVLESWAVTYDKFTYVDNHNHFDLGYSAVCYISAENCSSIYFNDYEIVPVTGKLLFFPGCLKHRVAPNLPRHGERISFSCNLYPVYDYTHMEAFSRSVVEKEYVPYA